MNETHDIDPRTGQPVGFAVDAAPAQPPQQVTLAGSHGSVERLDPDRHRDSLWEAVQGQPHIFTYMAFGPFADAAAFSDWLHTRQHSSDPYFYAIVQPSGRAAGLAALMSIRPEMRVVEVGNVLLSPRLQRTPLATEAQYLIASYASRRSAIAATSGNAMRSTPRHAARRGASGFASKASFATT